MLYCMVLSPPLFGMDFCSSDCTYIDYHIIPTGLWAVASDVKVGGCMARQKSMELSRPRLSGRAGPVPVTRVANRVLEQYSSTVLSTETITWFHPSSLNFERQGALSLHYEQHLLFDITFSQSIPSTASTCSISFIHSLLTLFLLSKLSKHIPFF